MTNFNNKEYLFHPVPDESVHQTVERNYYKYVAPQNQTPTPWSYNTAQPQIKPNVTAQIQQLKRKMNNYLVPQE